MTLRTASVFGSDMVLQQGKPLPVWGTAAPGARVECELDHVRAHTQADEQGRWRLTLPALSAGGPYGMTVKSGGDVLHYDGVWIGEVWLAGGQSNMELPLLNSENGQAALESCADPRLHFYPAPKVTTPDTAAQTQTHWQQVSPDTAAQLSAVAYYAAREIARTLDEHVGILECYWGGTYAHCWMPRELLSTFPEGRRRLAWYDSRVGNKTDAQFDRECAVYQTQVDEWNARIAARRKADPNASWAELNADCGLYPWPPPAGRTGFQRPGNLYESMLKPLCPYALRGFWYYQGEQDEEWAEDYDAELTALVRCWRRDWEEETLPFLLMQLPMYGTEFDWTVLRKAQSNVVHREPNMGLVVLADCGEADNIHPTDKQTPGTRLALLALERVYGKPVQGTAPEVIRAEWDGSRVRLHFDHVSGGLTLARGGKGFQLCGDDGVWHDAKAAVDSPDTVVVACAEVSTPTAVRYAWYNFGPADLYNSADFSAAPFFWIL